MIVKSISPSRISLFGGGTDFEEYYKTRGGLVINLAVNLYSTVTLYTEDDLFSQAKNSFPIGADPDFYYGLLDKYKLNGGHTSKIHASFDGIIESGLGSSASACVALLGAINKLQGLNLAPAEIAEIAYQYEIGRGIYGGRQDQIASTYGGVNAIEFKDKINVVPLARGFLEKLYPSLTLFYFGKQRNSGKIQKNFSKLSTDQVRSLDKMKELAVVAIDHIVAGDYETVGKMLDETWKYKQESNKGAGNKEFTQIYEKALKLGAIGGKLCGAGGGGYALFIVPPDKRTEFIKNFPLENVDFSVAWQGLDARIL